MRKNIDFGTVADLYDLYVAWEVDVPFFRDLCAGAAGEVLELILDAEGRTLETWELELRFAVINRETFGRETVGGGPGSAPNRLQSVLTRIGNYGCS